MLVVDSSFDFAKRLQEVVKPHIVEWATGDGSFVVVGLLETLSGKEREDLVSQLKMQESSIKTKGRENKGTKIVLEKIS